MNKSTRKAEPGDGLRSLPSTSLFRAINFELYAKPVRDITYFAHGSRSANRFARYRYGDFFLQNKAVMILGATIMLACSGYLFYMNSDKKRNDYQAIIKSDDTVMLVKKSSRWSD